MNARQVGNVLAKCAAFDNRTVGEVNILAWTEALADVDYGDALAAVTRHYRRSTEFVQVAHIVVAVREIHDERRHHEPHPIRALPSRFEPSEARTARVERGVRLCREAIGDTLDAAARKVYDQDDPIRDAAIRRARIERRARSPRSQPGAFGNIAAQVIGRLVTTPTVQADHQESP